MKKVILIHRWSGNPDSDWYPWLKEKLESKGFSVEIPEMPDTDNPQIKSWVGNLKKICPNPENVYLIGHSVGCQTILRYLEKIDGKPKKVIFVAPWINLTNLETKEEQKIAEPWLKTSIDFDKIKGRTEFTCILSDDDPYVPLLHKNIFKKKLGAKVIILHDKGHFTEEDNVTELPEILEFI
ncbi:hypothetical protein AUJ84_03375 [Candidatus Pacearchaeota archaeon CG1_02_32_132]|nr:MAG: hypothetical protein AUJ84_03375 [Candidatus Pacearchaeota archaeon CG1_02_32_132]